MGNPKRKSDPERPVSLGLLRIKADQAHCLATFIQDAGAEAIDFLNEEVKAWVLTAVTRDLYEATEEVFVNLQKLESTPKAPRITAVAVTQASKVSRRHP